MGEGHGDARMHTEIRKLYLAVGEEVVHTRHPEWGTGRVIEEMNSVLPGGASMIRVEFRNAGMKTFNNNIESHHCCIHAGLRRY